MNFLQRTWKRLKGLLEQYPELRDREHVLSMRSDDPAPQANGYAQAADDFVYHVWVQKAVSIWASSLAPLHLMVQRGTELLDGHPVLNLLGAPNPHMSSADLWRQWAVDMGLGGESGLEMVRNGRGGFVEIYPRCPEYFAVRKDPARERYFGVGAYVLDYGSRAEYVVSPDEFLHFKFYNPLNPWRGLAPHTAVRFSVVIDQVIQLDQHRFFKNGARPDFALIVPQGLTSEERRELETQLMARVGGARSHSPIILEQGVQDVKPFSFPRKDLEWLQQRRISRDELGAIWGVPDEIMGYGRDTYENFDTAERVLWTLTLLNLINFRDDRLTHFLRRQKVLRADEKIVTDVSRVWALRRAAKQQMTDARALFEMGVPFNTLNDFLGLGVGHIDGGDVGYPANARRPRDEEDESEGGGQSLETERAFQRLQHLIGGNDYASGNGFSHRG